MITVLHGIYIWVLDIEIYTDFTYIFYYYTYYLLDMRILYYILKYDVIKWN